MHLPSRDPGGVKPPGAGEQWHLTELGRALAEQERRYPQRACQPPNAALEALARAAADRVLQRDRNLDRADDGDEDAARSLWAMQEAEHSRQEGDARDARQRAQEEACLATAARLKEETCSCPPCVIARREQQRKADKKASDVRDRRKLKEEVVAALRGCLDCAERDPELLELDHVGGGDGRGERDRNGRGSVGTWRTVRQRLWKGESVESITQDFALRCTPCHRARHAEKGHRRHTDVRTDVCTDGDHVGAQVYVLASHGKLNGIRDLGARRPGRGR
jgi:hypothetical protein